MHTIGSQAGVEAHDSVRQYPVCKQAATEATHFASLAIPHVHVEQRQRAKAADPTQPEQAHGAGDVVGAIENQYEANQRAGHARPVVTTGELAYLSVCL